MFRSRTVYEICFRAREGLPLPPRPLINLLIESAVARTQRDHKVLVSKHVWLSNHPHMLVVSRDINALKNFYGELKKRLTDYTKRLLGEEYLSLWDSTTAAEVGDLEEAISRIIYFFLNPSKADLEDSIDRYPGVTSWKAFLEAAPSVDAFVEKEVPWIRLPSIAPLSSTRPSKNEEKRVIEELLRKNKRKERYRIYPFAWLKVFGVTEPREIEAIRQRIIARVREKEAEYRAMRALNKKPVLGAERLLAEEIMKAHTPRKRERKIFFLASEKSLRLHFLARYEAFERRCRECYQMLLQGFRDIDWPPGAFRPPCRPLFNPI